MAALTFQLPRRSERLVQGGWGQVGGGRGGTSGLDFSVAPVPELSPAAGSHGTVHCARVRPELMSTEMTR
jgi:hypothetical protein